MVCSPAGYVLGPVTGDHWFVYVADKCDRPDYTATDRTVRIIYAVCGAKFYLLSTIPYEVSATSINQDIMIIANVAFTGGHTPARAFVVTVSDEHDDVRHASRRREALL